MKLNMFDSWVKICGPSDAAPAWTIHIGPNQEEIMHVCKSKKEAEEFQRQYRELFRWITQEVSDDLYQVRNYSRYR